MQAERGPPKLAMLPVLDLVATSLGLTEGRQVVKLVYQDGRVVELREAPAETKLTREQLDLYVLEPEA